MSALWREQSTQRRMELLMLRAIGRSCSDAQATDAEHKHCIGIARLPIQRTEFLIAKDETRRQTLI